MSRLPTKLLGILLLTVAAFIASATTVVAGDVLEFIDIPTDERQATIDPMLSCRNGVMFGFHALDRLALHEDGPRRWDVSFAKDDGNLLIKEYPLWLGEAEAPLVRNGMRFPYAGTYTLLWNERVPVAPLTTCVSGAGTGFCSITLDIEDCTINPWLVADIAQIGEQTITRIVTDTLLFEVRAYRPEVGTNNGDGIARIAMQIINVENSEEVYAIEYLRGNLGGSYGTGETPPEITYCAFSDDCQPWIFSDHDHRWPSGEPVENGFYLLRATISTPDNTRKVVETQIEIDAPPIINTAYVPGGEFTMGSDSDFEAEHPIHTVAVDDIWIMKTEVTNKQYGQCVRDGICTEPKGDARWNDADYAGYPVTGIDWEQANTFATWLGGRLPTEAEWEKACRSDDGRAYPWGDQDPTSDVANYENLLGDTTPVDSYPGGVSPYGVLNMSGNAWEWTSSLYEDYPYQVDDGREEPNALGRRVVRGGSYYYTHYQLTCTFRWPVTPETVNTQIGLRVVFDQPMNPEGVRFVTPVHNAVVPPSFAVEMAANGVIIEPAGEVREGTGHFHILIDTDFVPPGELVPFDANHLHFGQGNLSTTVELEPGEHTLRLQVANGAHIALEGDQYRSEITITVSSDD